MCGRVEGVPGFGSGEETVRSVVTWSWTGHQTHGGENLYHICNITVLAALVFCSV